MAPVDGSPGVSSIVVHLPPGYPSHHCAEAYLSLQYNMNVMQQRADQRLAPSCRYHQYKFIVDGEWRHDEMQPFMPDPLGNVNNWLFVRKPESQSVPQQLQQSQSASSYASSCTTGCTIPQATTVCKDLCMRYLQLRKLS